MPLVRVEVRNEYGLGMPELYTETNREDPKAVLEGVAVAGLVGLLRQLGDLAEFAAEIFHGLQEQVLITSSRSHKLIERVHHIEVALPPLEKAILAQRSHLHFAYTAGSHWHTRIRTEQNHFIYSDLPRCIMDSYEDCHDPPRLSKLDKFDIGGPGSCFRRYSDPTYFKRSSTGPYGAHLQSVPRQKKARRNKKKRSSSKYKDVTRGAHVITHSGRYNANVEDKSSLSQDALTFHVPRKSGIEREFDHLTSFDSKTGSSYIECIFRPSCSTQSEDYSAKEPEPEPEPEPSSDSNVQQNLDSASLDETINNSYSAEDSRSKSSYITWDEKLEIIDSAGQPDESTEIPCKKIDTGENEDLNYRTVDHVDFDSQDEQPCKKIDTGENEDLNYRTVDHVDFDSQDEQPCTMPVVLRGQHDEIESETDYYMDALNTIESESENDQDCHTKRELKQYVNVNDQKSDLMNNESQLEVHVPERKSDLMNNESQLEVHVPEKTYLSPTSIPLESHMESNGSSNSENHEDVITHMAEISPTSLTTSNRFKAEEVERIVTKAETVASPREVETIVTKPNEPISSYESPKPLISTSGGQSQTTVNNPVPLRSTSGGQTQTTVNNPVMFWTNGGLLGLEPSKPPDYGSPTVVGPNPVKETKTETKTDSTQHSGKENNINDIKSESSGKVLDEVDEHDPIGSSRIFEFSNRLLVNGFRKQISLVGNERLANSVKTEVPENGIVPKRYETVTGIPFKEQFGNRSSLISPSSPPLEHMKISFQPIDGFETSKLKLAFPDGNGNANESNGHMFPSFQLIPEPAIEVHEFVSDSDDDDDDDTFCRSSPYASDDCRSNPSESNSEQWDSSESPRIKDHELDDAFGRISVISSAESASSSVINGGMIFDIPSFDSIKASQNQVANDLKGPTPPPLPPMEWRGVKSTPDATMEKEDDVELSEALTYSLNLTPKQLAPPPQPKLPPRKQDNNVVETDSHVVKHNQPDWQNLHTQNRSTHMFNGKAGDEKEDFLQQIRTKSRNLRRISTAQPTATSTGPASNKVTAILEKASAIRQAVGSDDGEDNWSDV